MNIEVAEVVSDNDIEAVRILRNLTTDTFAYFNGYIESEHQAYWWIEHQGRVKAWLYWTESPRELIGYGMLREEDGRWWNSVAVHPDQRAHGYGSYITHDLIARHPGPIYSAIRRDNFAAIGMHHPSEWREIDGPEPARLIYLVTTVP